VSTILLLLDHHENRRLLQEQLAGRYDVIIPTGDEAIEQPFDLGIVDGPALERMAGRLAARRAAAQPLFLPILFVTSRQDVRLVTRNLWQVADELILTPIERVELGARVEILLRARNYTLELSQAHRALAESEATYRAVGEVIPYGVWTADPEGRIVYVSRSLLQLLGKRLAEMQGEGWFHCLAPDVREQARTEWARCVREGCEWDREFDLLGRDGRHHIVWSRAVPVRDERGRITGWAGLNLDVTARKQQEQELAEERALFLSLFDLLPLPIIVVDHEGHAIRTNPSYSQVVGTERLWREIQLLRPDTHAPLPKQEQPSVRALHGEVVRNEEYVLVTPDGRQVPVMVQSTPIIIGGQTQAAAIALQDISALKEADRAKDQFLAVVSHELLSPVTSILGWERMAEANPEIIPQAMEVIRRNAQRQQRLVEDLLDVSRMVHGKFRVRPQPADLWELAAQSVEDARAEAQERQVGLRTVPPSEPLPVLADEGRIRQAIGNLLSNGIKFSERESEVTVEARREDDAAVLLVSDQGRGIAPEQLPQVFQPFRQLEREGESGLGLGLTLVRGIVEAHGGRVSAYSAGLGRGSTFTISLPLRREAPEARPGVAPPAADAAVA